MKALDAPNQLEAFIDKVMALDKDKPLFLGIVFAQLMAKQASGDSG